MEMLCKWKYGGWVMSPNGFSEMQISFEEFLSQRGRLNEDL